MKLDVLSVLEASYRETDTDEEWLGGVLDVVAPVLDRGLGVVATLYHATANKPQFSSVIPSNERAERFARIAGRVEEEPSAKDLFAQLYFGARFATASQKTKLGTRWPKHPAIAKHHVPVGVRDVLGADMKI